MLTPEHQNGQTGPELPAVTLEGNTLRGEFYGELANSLQAEFDRRALNATAMPDMAMRSVVDHETRALSASIGYLALGLAYAAVGVGLFYFLG